MKIAIPVEKPSMEADINAAFGRTPYFLIYNTDNRDISYITNTAAEDKGGAGLKASQLLIDAGVTCLLTPKCGEKAAKALQSAKIKMYQTRGNSVPYNLNSCLSGELPFISDPAGE